MKTDDAIRQRKTEKVLTDVGLPVHDRRAVVDELLALAGLAPFHRVCEESHRENSTLSGIEPWRFYALDAAACRKLSQQLPFENVGKIPAMLAAADALVLTTWLPNSGEVQSMGDEPGYAMTLTNMEHIAAASAAIQNLLLAATSRGIANYWSSGGVLRLPGVFDRLHIPRGEILLGAIFLFPQEIGHAELATSKLRAQRTSLENWRRWVEVD